MSRTWTIYHIGPIDVGWDELPTVQQVGMKMDPRDASYFWDTLTQVQQIARTKGWEGDYRDNARPRVFWLPDPDQCVLLYAFIWKQDNNGSTFVASPLPLSWLRSDW